MIVGHIRVTGNTRPSFKDIGIVCKRRASCLFSIIDVLTGCGLVIIFRVLNPARVGQNDEMDRGCQGFVVTEKELEGQGKDCCETDNDVWG